MAAKKSAGSTKVQSGAGAGKGKGGAKTLNRVGKANAATGKGSIKPPAPRKAGRSR